MGFNAYKQIIAVWFVSLMLISSLHASVYKTYTKWEIDALFVAWLINRHVDKSAEFHVVPKDTYIERKYAINTPNSRFRRSGRETAFESALRYYHIHNNCSNKLIPIIRVLEMAPWRKSEDIHILNFESDVVSLLKDENISAVFRYIDNYCKGEVK
jgi:hypothetical protein